MSSNFGNLKLWRKSLGYTQEEMGEKFKINWKTYSAYETGRISVPLEIQRKFQKAGFDGPWPQEEAKEALKAGTGDYITREEFAEWRGYWRAGEEKVLKRIEDLEDRVRKLSQRGASE